MAYIWFLSPSWLSRVVFVLVEDGVLKIENKAVIVFSVSMTNYLFLVTDVWYPPSKCQVLS